MPLIMPIKDLINTTENGYSDINRIDQSIYESEKEMDKGVNRMTSMKRLNF